MNDIIVAIDFSNSSIRALEFALYFAEIAKCNITMVWVDTSINNELLNIQSSRGEALIKLDELVAKYSANFKGGKLSYKVRKGKVYQEVVQLSIINKSFLIVVGAHGATGFEDYWIGSNAYRIVSSAKCPVITIKYDFDTSNNHINKIVLPIDATQDTIQKLPFAIKIAKLFNSSIYVLALHTTNIESMIRKVNNYVIEAIKLIESNNIPYKSESVHSSNLTQATLNYATAEDTDLIIIMTEQSINSSNYIIGPNAQQIINNSPVPVLNINFEQKTFNK